MKKTIRLGAFFFFLIINVLINVLIIVFSIQIFMADFISPIIAKNNLSIIEKKRKEISVYLSTEDPVLNDYQVKFRMIYYNPWLGLQRSLQINYYTEPTIMSMETITGLPLNKNEIEIKEGEKVVRRIFLKSKHK